MIAMTCRGAPHPGRPPGAPTDTAKSLFAMALLAGIELIKADAAELKRTL